MTQLGYFKYNYFGHTTIQTVVSIPNADYPVCLFTAEAEFGQRPRTAVINFVTTGRMAESCFRHLIKDKVVTIMSYRSFIVENEVFFYIHRLLYHGGAWTEEDLKAIRNRRKVLR